MSGKPERKIPKRVHVANDMITKTTRAEAKEIKDQVEERLGRKLNDKEVIHHVNGNPFDNHIDNLKVMTYKDHGRLHADLDKKNVSLYGSHMQKKYGHKRPVLVEQKSLSIKKLYKMRDEWMKDEKKQGFWVEQSRQADAINIATSFIEFVNLHRND